MTGSGFSHTLGRIEPVARDDVPALSRDVPLEIDDIQAAWPAFEEAFDSLRGRHIADAFEALFEHADHDPARPLIEYYRRAGQIDCLVPTG